MIKRFLSGKKRLIFYRILLLMAVAAVFPLLGGDCSSNNIIGGTPGTLIGSWQLSGMTGYLQDVCERETIRYDTNGTAILQCPGSNPITRTYTVSNNILTYTETSVSYNINTLTTTTLVLEGRNVGRTLTYTKLPADNAAIRMPDDFRWGKNSSE